MKFATKLTVTMSGILIFFAAIVSYVVYKSNIETLEKQIKGRQMDLAQHIMDKIDRMLFERLADIKVIASDPIVSSRDSTPRQIRERLSEFRNYHKTYISISLFDLNRVRIADTSGLGIGVQHPLKGYWKDVLKGKDFIMDVSTSASLRRTVFHFAFPVKDKSGETFGVVVTRMPVSKLYYIIREIGRIQTESKELQIDLIDKDGLLLYSNYNRKGILKDNLSDWQIVRNLLAGQEIRTGRFNHRGIEDIYVFVHEQGYLDFKGNDWGLLIHVPAKVAFAPAVKLRNIMFSILVPMLVFIVLILLLLSRKLTNPIIKLRDATIRIGKGDRNIKLDINTKDEIGELANSFIQMNNNLLETTVARNELIEEISERKKAEEGLRESEAQFRSLFEQAAVGIVHVASNGQFLRANKRFCEITGYTEQEILERTYRDITYPGDLHAQNEARKKVLNGETTSYRIEKRYIRKDGTIIWGNLTAGVLIRKPSGEPNYFVSVLEDITEKKKMEVALLQSEKLRAMGMITSGVAHDFNNILAVISGNVQLMERNYGDSVPRPGRLRLAEEPRLSPPRCHKEMMDELHIIRRAVSDGAEIVRRMRRFTKVERDTSEFMSVDIKNILEQAIEFSRPRWMNMAKARGITYDIDKKGLKKVPAVLGSPSELREVFVNIINNALDAMTGGGCISFRTWHHSDTLNKEDTVFVSISDTGEGMTEEVRKRIFDPFFTTKRAEGSGLGMSVAYGVITGHGGKIEVESEVGKGATFTLSIPITRETLQQAVSPEPPRKIKAKKLRILVVDDEEKICSMLNKYLSRDGHDVKSVNNGTEAIKLLKNEDFDLVLCDLVLPDISGHDVVKVIDELDKRPRVGLITGWDEKIETKSKEELKVDFIIRKPFDFSKLSSRINEALSAG